MLRITIMLASDKRIYETMIPLHTRYTIRCGCRTIASKLSEVDTCFLLLNEEIILTISMQDAFVLGSCLRHAR